MKDDPRNVIINSKNKNIKLVSKLWYFQIFGVSLILCFVFAIISQLLLISTGLGLALFLVLFLIFVSVVFDIIAVAVTASNIKYFLELKREHNLKEIEVALKLVKNADKVSSVCGDVIGDICGIVSGASGMAVAVLIIKNFSGLSSVFLSTLISSAIAALTVLGKALGKTYAINHSTKIVLFCGKFLKFFLHKHKNSNSKSSKKPGK